MFEYLPNFSALDLCEWRVDDLPFDRPMLLHIAGKRRPPVFISTLLHGDEWTGLHALQDYIRQHGEATLPRETYLLIGNPMAARANERFLDGQRDMNRVWGIEPWANELLDKVGRQNLFACVDIHNNTGRSPHYAIVARHKNSYYQLATLFGPNVIYMEMPTEALSIHMAEHVPSITLECGLSDQSAGLQHTTDFLDGLYHVDHLPDRRPAEHDINLYETLAVMKVRPDHQFSTGGAQPNDDISILPGVVNHNFVECPAGTPLATFSNDADFELVSCYRSPRGTSGLLTTDGNQIVLADQLVPCMLTEKKVAIEKDCFGYLMKRVGMQSYD